ncbi:MAG: rpmI [Bacillales bacterium]|jgi:large subunit ribosomal protein L35|nr:rpmI [Bacillales bacterium]
MPKMKTHRGAAKRVKRTGSGGLKRDTAYGSHLAHNKSTKQKRHLNKSTMVHPSDFKRVKQMLTYL